MAIPLTVAWELVRLYLHNRQPPYSKPWKPVSGDGKSHFATDLSLCKLLYHFFVENMSHVFPIIIQYFPIKHSDKPRKRLLVNIEEKRFSKTFGKHLEYSEGNIEKHWIKQRKKHLKCFSNVFEMF